MSGRDRLRQKVAPGAAADACLQPELRPESPTHWLVDGAVAERPSAERLCAEWLSPTMMGP